MSASTASRVHIARRKAAALGLRLRQTGNIYTLRCRDGAERVAGGLGAVESYLADNYRPRASGPQAARIPAAWAALIGDYCLSLSAAGHSVPTVRLRRLSLAHIARGMACAPTDVTAGHLVGWFGRQRHWSPATRRSYRAAARGFFAWAYRNGHLSDYLGDHLPAVREAPAVPRPVPDQAWRDALAAADARTTLMLRLAAEAGLRRAEVARVHTDDLIDSGTGNQLLVHGKGGKKRVVPISDDLAGLIRRGPGGHTLGRGPCGWLFPNESGAHLTPAHVGVLVGRVLPAGYSMHKLRTRFATRAYRGTRNLRAVQALLGHASVATTERYTAVDDDEIRAAAMAAAF